MQNTRNKELVSSYLKMHTTLSNAFKETEAVNGMYVKKMDETTFKEYFESHLKKLATCEDYDVCLTDGSKFNYGTYAEGCPTGTCTELTIDTNGNRMPNKSGKDIFTMLVTDRGIKALGESNMCETGLDCGAYILANHKLYDGTVEEVAPPAHEPTPPQEEQPIEPPVVEPQPTLEELQAAYEQCKTEKGASACYNECKSANSATCKLANGEDVVKMGDYYIQDLGASGGYEKAVNTCTDKGLRLPTGKEIINMHMNGNLFNGVNQDIWVSDEFVPNEHCTSGCHYVANYDNGVLHTCWTRHEDKYDVKVICVAD